MLFKQGLWQKGIDLSLQMSEESSHLHCRNPSSTFASGCQTAPVLLTAEPLAVHPVKPAVPLIQSCGG